MGIGASWVCMSRIHTLYVSGAQKVHIFKNGKRIEAYCCCACPLLFWSNSTLKGSQCMCVGTVVAQGMFARLYCRCGKKNKKWSCRDECYHLLCNGRSRPSQLWNTALWSPLPANSYCYTPFTLDYIQPFLSNPFSLPLLCTPILAQSHFIRLRQLHNCNQYPRRILPRDSNADKNSVSE